MKTKLKEAIYWVGVSAIGIVIGFSLQFTKAWSEPTTSAPNGNVGAPINTSIIDQVKSGGMVVSNGIVTSVLGATKITAGTGGVAFPDGTVQTTASAPSLGVCNKSYVNGSEDKYSSWIGVRFWAPTFTWTGTRLDTCNGDVGNAYTCSLTETRTCNDVQGFTYYKDYWRSYNYRTVTCVKQYVCSYTE
ncbi:MAG: hypothetical protein HGA36_00670 [Candidatus Moranbacteria bacterium]|nr:hypothetical protein [Candidatus Moranbacteria bacterium]